MDVRRAVAGLLLLGLLVSCSDNEPSSDPPEPTSSATVSPSPTAPVIPAEARGSDEASAKAFVRYWFDLLSGSMLDGDVSRVRALSTRNCTSCRQLTEAIAEVYAEGGRFQTQGWKVELISRMPGSSDTRPDFLLRTRHTERDLFGEDGDLVDTMPMAMVAMRVLLVPHDGSWQLKELEELK